MLLHLAVRSYLKGSHPSHKATTRLLGKVQFYSLRHALSRLAPEKQLCLAAFYVTLARTTGRKVWWAGLTKQKH